MVACSQQQQKSQTAAGCLEEAEAALANDSIRQGETLLRKAIQLSEASEDWHTNYIAYQRLASSLSQGNPEEALRLMKKALTIYEQHPDDERNNVMLLDYAGTYAAQVAFNTESSYDEALDFINRAYNIAEKRQMTDLMCQSTMPIGQIQQRQPTYDLAHYKCWPAATSALTCSILQKPSIGRLIQATMSIWPISCRVTSLRLRSDG